MRLRLAIAALLAGAVELGAQPAPALPEVAPVPQPRPTAEDPTPRADDGEASGEGAPHDSAVAEPAARAGETEASPPPAAAGPGQDPPTREPTGRLIPPEEYGTPVQLPAPPPEPDMACEAELRELGVAFERREPIDGDGSCGVALPYNIREIAPGVRLRPDTEMTCRTALAMARWVETTVLPATEALGENIRLTGVTHASTYVCRGRNNRSGTKMSEHASGAAIDVSSFDFEGREPIPIVPRRGEGDIVEAFQRAVRAGACLYFTTVLGPGSDEYHDDHLHLDIAERRRGFRLCQ